MRSPSRLYFLIIIICLPVAAVYGDYLEVRRRATIKVEPDRDAEIIERVEPGINLELLDEDSQTNGYYNVRRTSQGPEGWIYRTLVRRHPGQIPIPEDGDEIVNPLADPTYRLTPQARVYATRHLRIGKPQAVYERVHEGYVLAQDARLKIPLWVQYELSQDDLAGPAERDDDYRPDTSIPFGCRAELLDYRNSGYDRGHMAPAEAMDRSNRVMSESFLLSNMAPQVGVGFNRHIWAYLEAGVRGWVEQLGSLTVITGPVFAVDTDSVSYEVIGRNNVAVPTHFYKIIVDAQDLNDVEALAFMLPNENLTGRQYSEFLTTIDEIEIATGLDFLCELPEDEEATVESHRAPQVW
jgi:endonuclease G